MLRDKLEKLARDVKQFNDRTYHLKLSQGEQIDSMAILLENERAHDPLRPLLPKKRS